jgi:hypothetical protein
LAYPNGTLGGHIREPRIRGLLGPNFREFETFLPAYYEYPALPLALALKGIPRLQMVAAWFLLAVFYGTFWYT